MDEKTIARFWAKVDRSGGPDACWPWTAYRHAGGYGRFNISHRKPTGAHRVAWALHGGEIPPGLFVCHRCDCRPCCNPSHLFVGTAADNWRDAREKGRLVPPRGERNRSAKLTEGQVAEIRKAQGLLREIAPRFGVSIEAISAIKIGKRWSHSR